MPRILIINLAQGTGHGAEKVLMYLLEGGKGTLEREVVIAAPPGSDVFETANELGYSTLPWPAKRSGLRFNTAACLRFARELPLRPSLVHAWHPEAFEVAQILGFFSRCPVTGTLHDAAERFGRNRDRYVFWSKALRGMRSLVLVSEKTAQGWRAQTQVPIRVIHNGLPEQGLGMHQMKDNAIHVGFLGCYAQWKGMEVLPYFMEKTRDLPLHWDLYGKLAPGLEPVLQEINASFGDRVSMHGHQETTDIYNQIDLVIHPSIRHDPYPTVLLEAARAGLPVVVSDVGGVSEIVSDGETGFIYDRGNKELALEKLRVLATDRDLYLKLSKKARERYEEKFRVAQMLAGYRQFWSEQVENKTQTRDEEEMLGQRIQAR